jgi:hypothetical protein
MQLSRDRFQWRTSVRKMTECRVTLQLMSAPYQILKHKKKRTITATKNVQFFNSLIYPCHSATKCRRTRFEHLTN